MARDLGLDDVVDHFALIGDELDLLHTKSGSTRLGFAALLKFLLWRGRFPRAAHELPGDAVAHLARQVRAPDGGLASFDFAGRSAQRFRGEIRGYTGFRECSVADAEALAGWLAEHVTSGERRPERVRDELILRCRAELIEPPTPERVSEIARSALYQAEQALLALIADRLDAVVVGRLEALIAVSDDDDENENVLGLIKAAPGNVSLENAGAGRQRTNQVCEQRTLRILRRSFTELTVQSLLAEGRNMPFEVAVHDALNESPR